MAREISRAEAFERAHEIFSQINFNSFDYNTIKESLLDYVKLYFPEDFNDYIESSEFIAIVELFAYIGELLAYRVDINAHENFITTAQRKESVLRLAKMISYKASRNLPNRGLVKMTSISTTETVFDSLGRNLSNRKIIWNDPNNSDWKEQFLLVMNRVLEQDFGTVAPNERVQVDDVLFELYTLNNNPLASGDKSVFSFSTTVSGTSFPMEAVPSQLVSTGPEEKRPEVNAKFSLVYGNDGLGDGSDTTGFLMFVKQGTLQRIQTTFDGVTPNQTFDILTNDINETDLYVNNVDADSREIIITDPFAEVLPHLVSEDLRYGEWVEVDLANAQNILFNTNKNRHKYEVEALDDDQVRLVFGDGEFSDIPNGSFDIWYRTSANEDVAIPKSAIADQSNTFTYNDVAGNVQTITFAFSLISSLQNGSASETIDHIRRVAPSVYYTQDRMVNARDYNVFMLQDPSILKMRSINRTFAGDSKYIAWHDPRENYEDVKLFGDDLALYWQEDEPTAGGLTSVTAPISPNQVLYQMIEPLLSSIEFFLVIGPQIEALGGNPGSMRRNFNDSTNPYATPGLHIAAGNANNEVDSLYDGDLSTGALQDAFDGTNPIVDIYYSTVADEWTVNAHPDPAITDSMFMIRVEAIFGLGALLSGWDVRFRTRALVADSQETRFWNTNQTNQIQSFDTLNTVTDKIIVLQANSNANGTGLLDTNREYGVLSQRLLEQNLANAGLPNIHSLSVAPADTNEDGIPDNLLQPSLFDLEFEAAVDNGLLAQNELNYGGTLPEGDFTSGAGYEAGDVILLSNGATVLVDSPPGPGPITAFTITSTGNNVSTGVVLTQVGAPVSGGTGFTLTPESENVLLDEITLPRTYLVGYEDEDVEFYHEDALGVRTRQLFSLGAWLTPPPDDDPAVLIRELASFPSLTLAADEKLIANVKDHVYFSREASTDPWMPVEGTNTIRTLFLQEDAEVEDERRYKREEGRFPLNFAWFHFTPRLNLVDPSATNIIDMYIVTVGYYTSLLRYLRNQTDNEPTLPTPSELRSSYKDLLDNKMISDTVILHPGEFKILFGSRADPSLRATFKVIRPADSTLTDNEVKVRIVETIQQFFDVNVWDFGESFFFTELSASIHAELGPEIDSIVLVPTYAQTQFGDLFQIQAREDELFLPDISTSDIEIVLSFTPENIRQNES